MRIELSDKIKEAAEAILKADAVLITTGAGMGVDSGLPDFRGDTGFWKAYPPIAKLGISFYEMANPEWFSRDPEFAWAFYGHRLNLYRNTEPHKGYQQLLSIVQSKNQNYFAFTSNVDGQLQKAGFDEQRMEECHGSIHHFQCCEPCCNTIWSAKYTDVDVDEECFRALPPLPACPQCRGTARPNILMFGDWGWLQGRTSGQSKRMGHWLNSVEKNTEKLVIIEIGAGKAVPTVRYKSESITTKDHDVLIRINPRDYDVPHGHIGIPLGGAEGIDLIYKQFQILSRKLSKSGTK